MAGTFHLRACPFCGMRQPDDLADVLYPTGQVWRERSDGLRSYHSRSGRKPGDGEVWVVDCNESAGGCGAQVHGDSAEEAVGKWNRRRGGWLARLLARVRRAFT